MLWSRPRHTRSGDSSRCWMPPATRRPIAAHASSREMSAAPAQDACAIGNILASALVPPAMLRAFQADPSAPLAERLLHALEEGLAAGGEPVPVRSAHLLVVEHESFPLIDLRVDWHDTPIAELRTLWQLYAPQSNDYCCVRSIRTTRRSCESGNRRLPLAARLG